MVTYPQNPSCGLRCRKAVLMHMPVPEESSVFSVVLLRTSKSCRHVQVVFLKVDSFAAQHGEMDIQHPYVLILSQATRCAAIPSEASRRRFRCNGQL